jgi:hypothetical protein
MGSQASPLAMSAKREKAIGCNSELKIIERRLRVSHALQAGTLALRSIVPFCFICTLIKIKFMMPQRKFVFFFCSEIQSKILFKIL